LQRNFAYSALCSVLAVLYVIAVVAMTISQILFIAQSSAIAITHWLSVGICGYAIVANLIVQPSLSIELEKAKARTCDDG
jgi:hypothetical protein